MGTLAVLKNFVSGSPPARRRGIAAAQQGRLTNSWATQPQTLDSDIKKGLRIARARCRDASINNDYVKNYLRTLKTNVIGPVGIVVKPQSLGNDGKADTKANTAVGDAFKEWSRVGSTDVTGKLSFVQCQNLFLETVAKDGEVFVRKHKNWSRNGFNFALEFIDPEAIDVNFNHDLKNGHIIQMGIELDTYGAPAAYYVMTKKISADNYSWGGRKYIRIPADEIIHGFLPESILQTRGYPWLAVALFRSKMLQGYEEAELVAARVASAKMGFFEQDLNTPGEDEYKGDTAEDGSTTIDAEPGTFEDLPVGKKFVSFDPQHPTTAYAAFTKQQLRGMSAGLGVSYFTLANDLEGVNYSSGRLGALEDREVWKGLQNWMIDIFMRPVVEEWLMMALLSAKVRVNGSPLRSTRIQKYKRINFQGRRWQWVDPQKDMNGQLLALGKRLKSPQMVIGELGLDPVEVLDEWQEWEKMLESRNLSMDSTEIEEETEESEEESEDTEKDKGNKNAENS